MEKVDIAIAVLGAVAIISTGLGIGLYDDGNLAYTVTTSDEEAFTHAAETVPSGGLLWEDDVPVNGYDASGTLTIDWSGTQAPDQAFPAGATVDVTVEVTGPNGVVETLDGSFPYTDKVGTIDFAVENWVDVPSDFDASAEEAEAMQQEWNSPLFIEIIIQGPQGSLPNDPSGQLPASDDPVYTAAFDGHWHTFRIAQDTPELENI